jgi:hypothetical protein
MQRNFSIVLLALLSALSGLASAQDAPKNGLATSQQRCDRFKLRVIEPPNAEQYKMQVVKPDDSVDYKGIVIDPCAEPAPNVSRVEPTTPFTPNFFIPSTPPAKPSNDWFKAPPEMFKPFAPFKAPEK